jgi:hypothetical protein
MSSFPQSIFEKWWSLEEVEPGGRALGHWVFASKEDSETLTPSSFSFAPPP